MPNQERSYEPGEKEKIQENQISSMAGAIEHGARVVGEAGRVEFTKEQVAAARKEMRYEKDRAYRKMVELKIFASKIAQMLSDLEGLSWRDPNASTIKGYEEATSRLLAVVDRGGGGDCAEFLKRIGLNTEEWYIVNHYLARSVDCIKAIAETNQAILTNLNEDDNEAALDHLRDTKKEYYAELLGVWKGIRDTVQLCISFSESE